jgi:hypothetical protein
MDESISLNYSILSQMEIKQIIIQSSLKIKREREMQEKARLKLTVKEEV